MWSLGNRTPEVPSEACAANEIRWDQSLGGGAACAGVARGGGGADAVGVGPGCAAWVVCGRGHNGGGAGDPGRDAGNAGHPFELPVEAEYAVSRQNSIRSNVGLILQPSSCVDDNFRLNAGRFVRAIADEKKGAAECWFTG